jgi:hypothetical protein
MAVYDTMGAFIQLTYTYSKFNHHNSNTYTYDQSL